MNDFQFLVLVAVLAYVAYLLARRIAGPIQAKSSRRIVIGLLVVAQMLLLGVVLVFAFDAYDNTFGATARKRKRLETAEAMFQERCKKSGEFIHRTAENVEGILLLKVRSKYMSLSGQYELDDQYGRDLTGDAYIESLVRGSFQANTTGPAALGSPPRVGYRYVDVIDPSDEKRYRYTGSMKAVGKKDASAYNAYDPNFDFTIYAFVLDKTIARAPAPRYGVTYDDISTLDEREYWIAGSSLKVIDLQTNKVMAERIGYMMDRGQGNTSGGRTPWLIAADHACPSFQRNPLLPLPSGQGSAAQTHQTQDFVEKILKPKLDN